jgi:hypothetical protein
MNTFLGAGDVTFTEEATALDTASIAAEARRAAGCGPDEPLRFLDGLDRLTVSLDEEARLTAAGRARARSALVTALATQVRVRRLTGRFPRIGATPVRPVLITGLLRTGTTFLQHLLAQHPGLRTPELWELMAPAGPGGEEELVTACESYIAEYHRAAPEFRAIHPLKARLPEECHRLTANAFRHSIYALRYRVPGYVEWLAGRSMVPAYEFHRDQLRCVLWRRPGRPVVLKCPSHLWNLDAVAQVYPDAKVIRLHRSPAVAVPSVCSLTAVVRRARSATVDREEIGDYWLEQAASALTGLRRGAGPLATPPLDLRFADLVADPLGTAARVCDHIGVPLTEEARRRMTAFLATEGEAAPHRYTPEDFGLSRRRLDERFAGYLAEFDLIGGTQ